MSDSIRWRLASSIDDPFGMFGLPTAEIGDDFVQTAVVLRDVLVADSIVAGKLSPDSSNRVIVKGDIAANQRNGLDHRLRN